MLCKALLWLKNACFFIWLISTSHQRKGIHPWKSSKRIIFPSFEITRQSKYLGQHPYGICCQLNSLLSLTCCLYDRDCVTLRFIFEYGRQHDFILSRGTKTSQDVSVFPSTQNHLQCRRETDMKVSYYILFAQVCSLQKSSLDKSCLVFPKMSALILWPVYNTLSYSELKIL